MKMIKALLGASLWIMLTGCQTVNADYDQPALIVNPDADSRAALQAAVNEARRRLTENGYKALVIRADPN